MWIKCGSDWWVVNTQQVLAIAAVRITLMTMIVQFPTLTALSASPTLSPLVLMATHNGRVPSSYREVN